MQLIQGEIIAIMPPNFTDSWGNQYQDVTVRTVQGDVQGQKASKAALTENDIGAQVEWNIEVKQNNRNQNYNKFTKPQDPQYASQNRATRPQRATQGTKPQNNGRNTSINTSIERQCAFKAACSRAQGTDMEPSKIVDLARQGQYFIETGDNINDVPNPSQSIQTNPQYVGGGQEGICPHCQKPLGYCICQIPF